MGARAERTRLQLHANRETSAVRVLAHAEEGKGGGENDPKAYHRVATALGGHSLRRPGNE